MLNISPTTAIYYSPTPVKINRSFDGLCGIVAERMKLNPAMAGALFVFFNRRRTMVKTLCWEGDGFSIWSKRLEQGQFNVPSSADGRISLTYGELMATLAGIRPSGYYKRYRRQSSRRVV